MKHYFLFIFYSLISILILSSCSNKLSYIGKDEWLKMVTTSTLNSDQLSYETDQFLISHALKKRFEENPDSVIRLLIEQINYPDKDIIFQKPEERKCLSVLVELCMYMAKQLPEKEATKYWVSCNFYAYKYMFEPEVKPPLQTFSLYYNFNAMLYYNISLGEILRYIANSDIKYKKEFTLSSVYGKIVFHDYKSDLPYSPELFEEINLGTDYIADGYEDHSFSPGIGVPVVGKFKVKLEHGTTEKKSEIEIIPFTFLIKYDSYAYSDKIIRAKPRLYDYFYKEYVTIDKEKIPISKDYTNALAKFEDEVGVSDFIGKMHLLMPAVFEDGGLYMLSSYQKDKIPVVLVHGLMSDPRSMFLVLNSLVADRRIRRNYQFWMYYYSTGEQVFVQAFNFRKALLDLKSKLSKDANNEKFNNTILIGYSLGGVITRLSVQNSNGDQLKKDVLQTGTKNLDLTDEEKQFITDYLVFESLSFVNRVIFVVAPHKGTKMAEWGIANFFSNLILLPDKFVSMRNNIADKIAKYMKDTDDIGPSTVFRDLQPNSEFNKLAINLPYKKNVKLHSIIADNEEAGKIGGTDGVVDYWSAHLDNVDSEVVIKSDHYAVQNRDCIYEIKKILLENLKKYPDMVNKE